MRDSRSRRSHDTARQLGLGIILAALAIGAPFGCTREFYREWANQDVSEAVFEKSRDPRWRLDVFSVEPPMLARYADPYDQEVPPAPPDDPASEHLSPVPQWPDNRLLIPVEGTGYLDLLEYWRRDAQAKAYRGLVIIGGSAVSGWSYPPPEPEFWERPDNARHPVGLPRQLGEPGQPFLSPPGPPESPSPFSNPPPVPPLGGPNTPGTGTPPGGMPAGGPLGVPGIGPGGRMGPGARMPGRPRDAGSPLGSGVTPTVPGPQPAGVTPSVPGPQPAGVTPSVLGPQSWNHGPAPAAKDGSSLQVVRLQNADDGTSARPIPSPRSGRNPSGGGNSGTNERSSTPISLSEAARSASKTKIPPPRSAGSLGAIQAGQAIRATDRSLERASYRQGMAPARPAPAAGTGMRTEVLQMATPGQGQPAPATQPGGGEPAPDGSQVQPLPGVGPRQPLYSAGGPQPPAMPGQRQPAAPAASPSTVLDRTIVSQQPQVTPEQIVEAGRMTPASAAELSQVLVPEVNLQSDQEGYGYPKGARVYKVSMQQAMLLALMNARFYQFNLEQVYLAALPVTLQRFAFEPQFYASLGQVTGVPQNGNGGGGSFPPTPGVSASSGVAFNYATRYGPSGQLSTLNLGTVAGFGKLFNSGGQLLMGFANEVAFNFLSKNPAQPTVISALPISFVQPLLRGGGRAVTLEPLTQAERTLLYAVRSFALFRQQFFVVTLTGGTIQNFGNTFNLAGFSAAGNSDPTIGFIPVVFNLVEIEVDRRNLFFLESLAKLYQELIQGEASGLSRLQVDQVMQRVLSGRQALWADKITYRLQLDEFKMQMSLPPDTPMIVDMSLAQPFYEVFDAVDNWQRKATRTLEELPGIIAKIPELEDIDVEGRSVLQPYRNYRSTLKEFLPENEEGLEDLLESAVRISLEYRMDLMNNRAQLYDAWRQIRVTANALKGILNLTVSNNVYAPEASPNPFAFLSQAKQFGLTLNAELPLVRVNERNQFRTALINYQRLRRSLQTAEDNLKVQLRNDLRNVHTNYIFYEIAKRNFELNVRLKDQAFEQIIAPPAGGSQNLAQSANAAVQTTNILSFQANLVGSQLSLTNGWQAYQTARLIVYRDIGILPYDEWEAFSELFPAQYHGPIIGHAPAGGAGFTPPPEARTATPESR